MVLWVRTVGQQRFQLGPVQARRLNRANLLRLPLPCTMPTLCLRVSPTQCRPLPSYFSHAFARCVPGNTVGFNFACRSTNA